MISNHSSSAAELAFGISPLEGDLVSILSAYFDESYGASGAFSVAGYTFKQSALKPFEKSWGRMLRDYGLPYFRMSSCASGNGVFKGMTLDERDRIARRAISLIGQYACDGYGVSFRVGMLDGPSMQREFGGMQDYEWSCWIVMAFIRGWVRFHNWPGGVQYFFEAGHQNQARANSLLAFIAQHDGLRQAYRYRGHGFVEKETSGAVQAADILAWHVNKDLKRKSEGLPPRKDFQALLKAKHANLIFGDSSDHPVHHWLNRIEGKTQSLEEKLLEMPPTWLISGPRNVSV